MKKLLRKQPLMAFAVLPLMMALFFNPLQLKGQSCQGYASQSSPYIIVTVYSGFLDAQHLYDCGVQTYFSSPYVGQGQYVIVTDPYWFNFFVIPVTSVGMGRNASGDETKALSKEEAMKIPELAKIDPFTGTGGCTLYSEDKALVLKPAPGKHELAESRKAPEPLTLCKKDCDKPIQWAITPVNAEKQEGFYIHPAGTRNQVLCWTAEEGLSLRAKSSKTKEKPNECAVWYIPVGAVNKGKDTGYRIVSKASPNYGLVVDKTSGVVGVKPIFEEGADGKATQLVEGQVSVWTMGDCKPLPPEYRPKEKAQD